MLKDICEKIMEEDYSPERWNPLEDWNDCWELVNRMRELGWYLKITPFAKSSTIGFCESHVYCVSVDVPYGSEREGIVKAALKCVK